MGAKTLVELKDLDPSAADYAEKIDEGMVFYDTSRGTLNSVVMALCKSFPREINSSLRNIEGIVLSQEDSLTSSLGIDGVTTEKIIVTSDSLESHRKAEDILRKSFRSLEDQFRELRDRKVKVERGFEDFVLAAVRMTKVDPLASVNYDLPNAHFFITRPIQNRVYEGYVNLEKGLISGPTVNTDLKPEYFSNVDSIKSLSMNGVGTNVYLVTNPSKLLSEGMLLDYAGNYHLDQVESAEKKKKETMTGKDHILASVRKFVDELLG